MVVGMDLPAGRADGLAAVFRYADRHVHGVDAVELEWIGIDLAVILGVLHDEVRHHGPVRAGVFGAIEAAQLVGGAVVMVA